MCPTKFPSNKQEFRSYLTQWTVALILKYVQGWRPYLINTLGCSTVLKMLLPASVSAKVFKKRKDAQISGICGGLKVSTGTKTGVELCYYKPTEYKYLFMDEKDELRELRPESKSKERKSLEKRISKVKLLLSINSTKTV